jgi:ribosomal protein S18 acetylase RimI-like enzyme
MREHVEREGLLWDEEKQLERVKDYIEHAQIIVWGDQPIGLWKVKSEVSSFYIVQVQVSPEFQGKGITASLIQELQQVASLQDKSINLEVLKLNPAKRLYDRLGFKVFEDGEFAYSMRWTPSLTLI